MFSSQACSTFRSHYKLSPCRWSTFGQSVTNERGNISLDEPCQSSSQLLTDKKAHPKRHLICAIISSVLFFVTGVIAIFYAIKSLQCERNGYYEQALIHSRRSLSWSMATFVIALIIYFILGLLVVIGTTHHY